MAQPEKTAPENSGHSPRITFVLPQGDVEKLERIATRSRQSVSALVRGIVCAHLDGLEADAG